ncbi:hypothetical protein [Actinoplanes sp. G11-F43]|uniref:hypothetical protein n=1 Tax=Actinoplanes sp. G11-F43 TaxID=3424130 RepID=UPI003D34CC5A
MDRSGSLAVGGATGGVLAAVAALTVPLPSAEWTGLLVLAAVTGLAVAIIAGTRWAVLRRHPGIASPLPWESPDQRRRILRAIRRGESLTGEEHRLALKAADRIRRQWPIHLVTMVTPLAATPVLLTLPVTGVVIVMAVVLLGLNVYRLVEGFVYHRRATGYLERHSRPGRHVER